MSKKQTAESFWARVKGNRSERNGCWEWQGSCNNTGYGTVAWDGKVYTAHRVAAWLSGLVSEPEAPLSKGTKGHVLHTCDNRRCCNPSHFFIGNYTDNQMDAYAKARREQPKGEKHANAKLTKKEATQIKKLYATGYTQVKLAEKFLVSQRVISLIVRGESYK